MLTLKTTKYYFTLLIGVFLLVACGDKDPPKPTNEEEIITTLRYTLIPAQGNAVTLSFQDKDGGGGNTPVVTGGTLAKNTVYTGKIEVLNEQKLPAEDITKEVKEEGKEHQFFFKSTIAGLTVAYSDKDADNNPLGLETKVTTTDAGKGKLTVTLRHKPKKSADKVSDGDITNAGGETDIEVTFDIEVK